MDILCLKLSRANGTLSKLRHFAPLKTCLSVYYTILYSHLLHGCPAWSYAKEINIDRVNKLQKRCIRILTFSDFNLHASGLFPELKLLKVQDKFTLNKLIFMFDYIKGCIPDELRRLFIFNYDIHSDIMRSSEVFHIPKENTTRFDISAFSFDGAKLWNKFYFELLNKETNVTKSKLKTLLKTNFLNTYV